MTDCVPISVLRELIGAGLAGAALLDACARVAADLTPLLMGMGRPMSGAERMRLMRARRAASAEVVADVRFARDADVTTRDDFVTGEVDISGPGAPPPDAVAAVDSRLMVARKALTVAGLSGHAIAVGAAILEHFNRSCGRCDPGLNTLADKVQKTVRHVRRGVTELKRAGLFVVRRHGGHHHANAYEPQWAKMRELVAGWEAGGVVTRRHAEADKADRSVPQTQKKILTSGEVDRSDGRAASRGPRRPPAKPPQKPADRRQTSLMFPIPGGRAIAEQQAKSRLAMALTSHLSRFGARAAERWRGEIGEDVWQRAVSAEVHQRDTGLRVLLDALAPVAVAGTG